MGVIHVFRRLVYAQVVLGIIAWCVAEQNAVMVLIAGALSTMSWYIVEGPGGKPIPRLFINLGVVGLTGWMFYTQMTAQMPLIIALGEFILAIQILKLYEHKANRDYAQLIVLSLMQMICASIISADVVYGLLLTAYIIISLFTILLFQVKLSYDEVSRANLTGAPPGQYVPRPRAVVSRGHRRHFRVTAISCGMLVMLISATLFVLMPRGQAAGFMGDWQLPERGAVSGFDTQVRLLGGLKLATSRMPVLNLQVNRGGKPVGSDQESFLLRGAALDQYDARSHRWLRSNAASRGDVIVPGEEHVMLAAPASGDAGGDALLLEQAIALRAQTRGVLFTTLAPVSTTLPTGQSVTFNSVDQVINARPIAGGMQYTVQSIEQPGAELVRRYEAFADAISPAPPIDLDHYARAPVLSSRRVALLTESVLKEAGLERDPSALITPADDLIAHAIEHYLQTHCSYTLDLPVVPQGADPITLFLLEHRRGHCEYFASAMTTMLRSIGIRARLVTGYRASEYNGVGEYYVVRQRNAHAWVEAWSPQGFWRTYDPSPPAAIASLHSPGNAALAMISDLYDYIEFQWINNVITYDADHRQTVVGQLDLEVSEVLAVARQIALDLYEWFRTFPDRWVLGPWGYVFLGMVVVMIVLGLLLLIQIVMQRHHTMRQLQLEALSRDDKRRLTTHLAFYLQMLRVLERAGESKPVWQTPASFAQRLMRQDPQRYAGVVTLTDLFYEIRFGGRPLDTTRSRQIQDHLDRLRQTV
jgi:transglutaminase-like putative cysteine protease